jgi:hypothetical protein
MVAPFNSSPPTQEDWFLVASAAVASLQGDSDIAVGDVLASVEGGTNTNFPADAVCPQVDVCIGPTLCLINVQGTTTLTQWLFNVLGSAQVTDISTGQGVGAQFEVLGLVVGNKVLALVESLTVQTIVWMGHSLGGSVAQVASAFIVNTTAGANANRTYVIGCPRTGDFGFFDALRGNNGGNNWSLESTNDPICVLPPSPWIGVGSSFPISGTIGAPALYQQAANELTLDQAGGIALGGNGLSLIGAIPQVAALSAPTHLATDYLNRVKIGLSRSSLDNIENPAIPIEVWNANLQSSLRNFLLQQCALRCSNATIRDPVLPEIDD